MRKNNVYAHITDLTHGNRRKQDRIAWALQGRLEHGRITFNEDKNGKMLLTRFQCFQQQDYTMIL